MICGIYSWMPLTANDKDTPSIKWFIPVTVPSTACCRCTLKFVSATMQCMLQDASICDSVLFIRSGSWRHAAEWQSALRSYSAAQHCSSGSDPVAPALVNTRSVSMVGSFSLALSTSSTRLDKKLDNNCSDHSKLCRFCCLLWPLLLLRAISHGRLNARDKDHGGAYRYRLLELTLLLDVFEADCWLGALVTE
ncbi:hypothetical protein DL89DRAFT_178922 [Linderina pennispora]|uniref:Uncharacterized protein n=1 Tax=Linderina pennispora TaxID=61395 RepID=A0A1Y1W5M5_9FUNG|nr:uncharacterized protein DL89DRAFT_178922 [Linderina pennispora]ORX68514.1 hypothetical protein DL89DRAFT_178922 [Linderina pennispora]